MRALYGSAWPFPKNGTGQPRSADDHDSLHNTVPGSCVEVFLRLRHAALLDSVPRGPEHASVLRGTEPARQELRRYPAQCLADGILVFHSSNSDATVNTGCRSTEEQEAFFLAGRRSSQGNRGPKPVMAPIARPAGRDGPTMRSL